MFLDPKPRSKIAIGFYVLGGLMLLANLATLLTSGRLLAAVGGMMGARGAMGTIFVSLIAQPILIILFGGVVQVLVDIRNALAPDEEESDA